MGLAHQIFFLCRRTILWLGSVAPLAGLPTCILTVSTTGTVEPPLSLCAPHHNMGDALAGTPPPSMPTCHFGTSGPAARAPRPIEHDTKHDTGMPDPSPGGPAPTNTLLAPWTYLRPHLATDSRVPGVPTSSEHYTHKLHPQPVHYLLHPTHQKCFFLTFHNQHQPHNDIHV